MSPNIVLHDLIMKKEMNNANKFHFAIKSNFL